MCAINGVSWVDTKLVERMCASNKSRGPDYTSVHTDTNLTIGHNLLIINSSDLTKAVQPKISNSGTILAFNGQIYDVDAEEELDTDYLHRNLDEFGINFLRNINGSFAIAWVKNDILYLVRDHFGTKPLYYSIVDKGIMFSSTLPALLETDEVVPEFSEENIEELQRGNYWQNGPITVYKNIFKIAPGQIIKYSLKYKKITGKESVWDGYRIKQRPFKHFEYRSKVIEAINTVARSPQKVSLLLSGGLDSTLIAGILGLSEIDNFFAATLAYNHNPKVDDNPSRAMMNEVDFARVCTREHKLEHKVYTFPADKKVIDEYSKLCIDHLGSIFEDSYRMVPRMFLLENIAKEGAKVILTGDGGDEIFSGYNKHRLWMGGIDKPTSRSVVAMIKRKNLKSWFPLHVIKGCDAITAHMFIDLLTQGETYFSRLDAFAGAYGMESRAPFAYQDLVKYVFELPGHIKFKYPNETFRGINKFLIRDVFSDVIPNRVMNRVDKVGWSLPYWRDHPTAQVERKMEDQEMLESIVSEKYTGPQEP